MNTANFAPKRFLNILLPLAIISLGIVIYQQWPFIIYRIIEWQKQFHDALSGHIHSISEDPIHHGLMLILLSFTYGVFHAIGPGHGKAVIVTYLSSHKESLPRGALISFFAALLQSLMAITIVLILSKILGVQFSKINQHSDSITLVSYCLVMGLGFYLFINAFSKLALSFKKHNHSAEHNHEVVEHKHDHHHHGDSCCGGHHVHQSDSKETLIQSIGVILSMGIRPCAGAIVVLIYAHLVGAFLVGIIATLVMGFGTGIAVASIALGTQLARNWFENIATKNKRVSINLNIGLWIKLMGGIIIFILGFSLFQAANIIDTSHPLL